MATTDGQIMNIAWIVSSDYSLDPNIDIDDIKSVGPIWGSWRAWRSCAVDNVICDDASKAKELLARAFQAVCNFYLPRRHYQVLNRPQGAQWYDGEFKQDAEGIEDVIAMHLASASNDIVLLLGFDLGIVAGLTEPIEIHRRKNRLGLIRQIIIDRPDVQWVCLDHARDLDIAFSDITNITRDQFANALKLLH